MKTDFFREREECMIDEIFTFFFAGMKTIQISSTNLLYYLTKHQEYREKLMKEIRPPVDAVKNDVVKGLTYETVMELNYL